MNISDFDFCLPTELIAQQPPARRTDSRLLTVDEAGHLTDRTIIDLPKLLRAGDLLVLNDTQVIPARLFGRKASGGKVEVLVERLLGGTRLLAQLRSSRTPRAGTELLLGDDSIRVSGTVLGRRGDLFEIEIATERPLLEYLEKVGELPLPPYIERAPAHVDRERYQTVFAREPGAVAAPTAGLHFDQAMLAKLAASGVEIGYLTLHVGAGTFQPLRTDIVEEHRMHAERFAVSERLCKQIKATRRRGGSVLAVGTTVARSLESVCRNDSGEPQPTKSETNIYIYPGFEFRCVDRLLTNFHLPRSTLLLLVSAFAGKDCILDAYRHAIERRYRFFSYGDAMLLTRRHPSP